MISAAGNATGAALNGAAFSMLSDADPLLNHCKVAVSAMFAAELGADLHTPSPAQVVDAFDQFQTAVFAAAPKQLPRVAQSSPELEALTTALQALQGTRADDIPGMRDILIACHQKLVNLQSPLQFAALGRFMVNRIVHIATMVQSGVPLDAELAKGNFEGLNRALQSAIWHSLPRGVANDIGPVMWHPEGQASAAIYDEIAKSQAP